MSYFENLSELELIQLCMKRNVWSSLTRTQRKGYIKRLTNLNEAGDEPETLEEKEEKEEKKEKKETEEVSKELVKVQKPKINFFSGSFLIKTSNFIS